MSTLDIYAIMRSVDLLKDTKFGPTSVRFGSMRGIPNTMLPAKPRDPRVSPGNYFAGIPFVIDRNLPPWLGVLKWPGRGFEQGPITFIDMRRRPHTDDMAQMIDDLRKSNGISK
jgi:hypothetical protein